MKTNRTISHLSGTWLGTTMLRARRREERVTLQLPPPKPPGRKPDTEKKPEGGTCVIIQVWPTTPEPSGEDIDRTQ